MAHSATDTDVAVTPNLVVGWAGNSDAMMSAMRARTMIDLIAALRPKGLYSVRLVDEEDGPAIHCGFQNGADADRLAGAVGATVVGRYPGYRSQRGVVLDEKACETVHRVLTRHQARHWLRHWLTDENARAPTTNPSDRPPGT